MARQLLSNPTAVFSAAILLRAGLIAWSRHQDAHSAVKYTDIDYFVFTDAARFVANGASPYARDTYRYTPLLAWLLVPTTLWFEFGKVLFAAADVLAGWLLVRILTQHYGLTTGAATKYAAVWLLNPIVAGISTRGSCEGLLGVLATSLLLAVLQRNIAWAGVILGFAVHFKIYPFIYASSLVWHLDRAAGDKHGTTNRLLRFLNRDRILLGIWSLGTFAAFNLAMYILYGDPYIEHSWLYHLTRLDHRHNFSPYNTLLHINSSPAASSSFRFERWAFLPQLLLSAIVIPAALAKKDLSATMMCQTFAFVTFNKVCTSQYFLWYLIFFPIYLPVTRLSSKPLLAVSAVTAWVVGQAYWLYEGYKLEFLGEQAYVPGLWRAGLLFFGINCWILGLVIDDVSGVEEKSVAKTEKMS